MKKLLILVLAVLPGLSGCNGKNALKREMRRGAYIDQVGSGEEEARYQYLEVDEVGSGEEEQRYR